VLVERCRYLEQAGCASICINSCKVPTQVSPRRCKQTAVLGARQRWVRSADTRLSMQRGCASVPDDAEVSVSAAVAQTTLHACRSSLLGTWVCP
jgi:hypothetical protein